MPRLTVIVGVLLGLLTPTLATSSSLPKEIEVNGVRLPYVEHGSGEPMIFVHGALSGTSSWEPVRDKIAERYQFITYMQRYYGTGAWSDDGKNFSISTHADDLIQFIQSVAAGPVHLVGWSYGGAVATTAALKNPSLVRSLILYEANIVSVLPAESPEGRAAREDRTKMVGLAIAANKAGDPVQTIRAIYEAVYQLPSGGFDHLPEMTKSSVLENARTMPLLFAAPLPPAITCDSLSKLTIPTLVIRGEKTHTFYILTTEGIGKCVPGARHVILPNVNHDGPMRDPIGFSAAIFDFLSK